ncbi:hypothetical protein D3C81_358400 [compost metagenome]
MKNKLSVVLALCIGLIIGTATTTLAAPVKEYVQASFEKFKIVVNGEEQSLDADPLVYQGTTYLPVRTVSNALGYDVKYLADTKTIVLDESLDSLGNETNSSSKQEGDNLNVINSEEMSLTEKVTKIKNQLKSYNERLTMYENAVQKIQNDKTLSEEDKKWGIDLRQPTIESIKERINELEKQLAELEK